MTSAAPATDAYCPHCHLLIETEVGEWPRQPLRCPHCALLIGTSRCAAEPSSAPGAKGTAAGIFSRRAKRDDSDVKVSPQRVLEAIRSVAASRGERPDRLLMVDYQQTAVVESDLPSLHDVFAAFGNWKSARRRAADGLKAG